MIYVNSTYNFINLDQSTHRERNPLHFSDGPQRAIKSSLYLCGRSGPCTSADDRDARIFAAAVRLNQCTDEGKKQAIKMSKGRANIHHSLCGQLFASPNGYCARFIEFFRAALLRSELVLSWKRIPSVCAV